MPALAYCGSALLSPRKRIRSLQAIGTRALPDRTVLWLLTAATASATAVSRTGSGTGAESDTSRGYL